MLHDARVVSKHVLVPRDERLVAVPHVHDVAHRERVDVRDGPVVVAGMGVRVCVCSYVVAL